VGGREKSVPVSYGGEGGGEGTRVLIILIFELEKRRGKRLRHIIFYQHKKGEKKGFFFGKLRRKRPEKGRGQHAFAKRKKSLGNRTRNLELGGRKKKKTNPSFILSERVIRKSTCRYKSIKGREKKKRTAFRSQSGGIQNNLGEGGKGNYFLKLSSVTKKGKKFDETNPVRAGECAAEGKKRKKIP